MQRQVLCRVECPKTLFSLRHGSIKIHLLKYDQLVQIYDVFSLQIKYNASGYLSALTQKMKLYSRSFKSTYLQSITYFHSKEKKMAERTKQAPKAKRTSTSKSKTTAAAKELQNAAAEEAAVGVLDAAEGLEDLQAASDVSAASRDLLAEGASDATRGVDALKAARRAEKRSKKAAREGVRDLAEGGELLSASEELTIQSDIVREMSAEDLDHGMKLAWIAGQLWATSNVLESLDMPMFADFLDDKGQELQDLAVEVLFAQEQHECWQQQWQRQAPKLANWPWAKSQRVSATCRIRRVGEPERIAGRCRRAVGRARIGRSSSLGGFERSRERYTC